MKKLVLLYGTLALFIFLACQPNGNSGTPQLEIFSDLIDFGIVNMETDSLWKNITLKNSGSAPLYIEHVEVSCGCVVPQWSDRPIAPGEQKDISIALVPQAMDFYNKDPLEKFEKLMIIRSNSTAAFTKVNLVGAVDKSGLKDI